MSALVNAPDASLFYFDTVSFEDIGSTLVSFFSTSGTASFNNCQFLRSNVALIISVLFGDLVVTGCDVVNGTSGFIDAVWSSFAVEDCFFSGVVPSTGYVELIATTSFTDFTLTNSAFHNLGGRCAVSSDAISILIDLCSFTNSSFEHSVVSLVSAEITNYLIRESVFENNQVADIGGVIAISVNNPGSVTTMSSCTLSGNSVNGDGGALFIHASTEANVVIEDVLAEHNIADYQGGCMHLSSYYGETTFTRVTCANNLSRFGGGGGGIFFYNALYGSHTFNDVVFLSNTAGIGNGGGMCINLVRNSTIDLTNVFIGENRAGASGGGLSIANSDHTTIDLTSVVFGFNEAGFFGGGMLVTSSLTTIFLTDCEFNSNTASSGGGALMLQSNVVYNGGMVYGNVDHSSSAVIAASDNVVDITISNVEFACVGAPVFGTTGGGATLVIVDGSGLAFDCSTETVCGPGATGPPCSYEAVPCPEGEEVCPEEEEQPIVPPVPVPEETTGPCPVGGFCEGDRIWPVRGYWSEDVYSTPIACATVDACPGAIGEVEGYDGFQYDANGPVTQVCSSSYLGFACADCGGSSRWDNARCLPCPAGAEEGTGFLIFVTVFVILVVAIALIFLKDSAVDKLVSAALLLQTFSLIGRDASRHIPDVDGERLSKAFRYFMLVNFDVEFMAIGCGLDAPITFESVYWGSLAIWLVAFVLFSIASVIHTAIAMKVGLDKKESWGRRLVNRWIHGTVILFVLGYLQISWRTLQALRCSTTDSGTLRLVIQQSTECFLNEHRSVAAVAVLTLIFYIIPFPLVVLVIVVSGHTKKIGKSASEDEEEDSHSEAVHAHRDSGGKDAKEDDDNAHEEEGGHGSGHHEMDDVDEEQEEEEKEESEGADHEDHDSEHREDDGESGKGRRKAQKVSDEGGEGAEAAEKRRWKADEALDAALEKMSVVTTSKVAVVVGGHLFGESFDFKHRYGFLIRNLKTNTISKIFPALKVVLALSVAIQLSIHANAPYKLMFNSFIILANVVYVALVWPMKSEKDNLFILMSGLVTSLESAILLATMIDPGRTVTGYIVAAFVVIAIVSLVVTAVVRRQWKGRVRGGGRSEEDDEHSHGGGSGSESKEDDNDLSVGSSGTGQHHDDS